VTQDANGDEVVACELRTFAGTFFFQAADVEALARYQIEVLTAITPASALAVF
jgi:hypothetical protein